MSERPQPLAPPEVTQQPITLLVSEKDLRLTVGGSALDPIPIVRDGRGRMETEALVAKLRLLEEAQPDQATITLSTEGSVKYEDLVQLIDTVVKDGPDTLFPSVSVTPTT